MKRKLYVIIPAAGKGERMGKNSNKLFMDIKGLPVIARTLKAFDDFRMTGTDIHAVVVTNEDNIPSMREVVAAYDLPFVEKIVLGGSSRTESVYCGVKALAELGNPPQPYDAVFVHDGARCLVSSDILEDCLEKISRFDVCVAAVPMKSTVKIIADSEYGPVVSSTPSRDSLVEVQTPQCFKYQVLKESYENAINSGIEATDDTALAELLGYKVGICKGSYSNIKITTTEDISAAEALL